MNAPNPIPARSSFVTLQSGRYHLREWGEPDAPLLLMLHGWMDVSGTFQFLVEALRSNWRVVAPDWLGCGLSDWRRRPYWFAELMLDLDAIADHLSPDQPLRILGHSMGGNVASLWAGSRAQRLERLVLLESFGPPRQKKGAAHAMHDRWLLDGRDGPQDKLFPGMDAFEARLRAANPRLTQERASRIGTWLAREVHGGQVAVRVDPWHRNVFSHLVHQDDEFLSAWECIDTPVLWVTGDDSSTLRYIAQSHGGEAQLVARMNHMRHLRRVRIADSGHNVQHDQPYLLASAIEPFLLGSDG